MSEYKPMDLEDVLARSTRLRQFDGATFYEIAESGEEDEVAGLAQELAGQDVPALVAEVRRLRREMAVDHSIRFPDTGHCPACVAARSDGWNPSLPLDWTPEVKP